MRFYSVALLLLAQWVSPLCAAGTSGEILWDSWGIPHVRAKTEAGMFRAFGWAQAQSHGPMLMRLYAKARARSAEYWGEEHAASDRWMLIHGVPERAKRWYDAQPPVFRRNIDSFAEGINEYCRRHPESIPPELRVVLPISGIDVVAHTHRVVHYFYLTNESLLRGATARWSAAGSNAWAIAPRRSASGNALLLANPHMPWNEPFVLYEAGLTGPGVDAYGAAIVGSPVLSMGFNHDLGWTHTVNTIDGFDLYELTLRGDGYLWDGMVKPFEVEQASLRIKTANGLTTEHIAIRHSVHGPIIRDRPGKAIALRMTGLDQPFLLEQYWQMMRARDLHQFETAIRRIQIPLFTVIYADRKGHILHWYGGRSPIRPKGPWNWDGLVPGDSSASLWRETSPYEALPKLLDPRSGWLQSSNDAPWTTTFPQEIQPDRFPAYVPSPPMDLRAQSAANAVLEMDKVSLEDLVRWKHSTHMLMADRLLPDLLQAAGGTDSGTVQKAARVLAAWDRNADAESKGTILFLRFVEIWRRATSAIPYAIPWDIQRPLATPSGIRDGRKAVEALETAAVSVEKQFGALDVAWGAVNRFEIDGSSAAANGAPGEFGVLRVMGFTPGPKNMAFAGDCFVAAVEFSKPIRALGILGYGNASTAGSRHRSDQLPLMAEKRLRPIWFERKDVLDHMERRESIP